MKTKLFWLLCLNQHMFNLTNGAVHCINIFQMMSTVSIKPDLIKSDT